MKKFDVKVTIGNESKVINGIYRLPEYNRDYRCIYNDDAFDVLTDFILEYCKRNVSNGKKVKTLKSKQSLIEELFIDNLNPFEVGNHHVVAGYLEIEKFGDRHVWTNELCIDYGVEIVSKYEVEE